MNTRQLFLQHVAQTSDAPLALHIKKAKGSLLWDADGKEYIDPIAGVSVCNIGHRHPKVVKAIRDQADEYLHVLVYGEMIETPQVQYAALLTDHLPTTLNSVYFTNSGAEAVEGAMKLAKKATRRTNIIAFHKSYHGSTQGALSVIGDEYWRNAFRPLLPGILHLEYNSAEAIEAIDHTTACVIMETVQAERGVFTPDTDWIQAVRDKCTETGALFILDEIQTGFGRTGTLWGFEQYDVVPDILLLGKALGGGMPLGAFIADRKLMSGLSNNPVLGHITTFGGHPVCCAAGLAAFKVLLNEKIVKKVKKKAALFQELLSDQPSYDSRSQQDSHEGLPDQPESPDHAELPAPAAQSIHPDMRSVRSAGLLMAFEFENEEVCKKVVAGCQEEGLLTDWFLFAPQCLRIAPPLTISSKEIRKACEIMLRVVDRP